MEVGSVRSVRLQSRGHAGTSAPSTPRRLSLALDAVTGPGGTPVVPRAGERLRPRQHLRNGRHLSGGGRRSSRPSASRTTSSSARSWARRFPARLFELPGGPVATAVGVGRVSGSDDYEGNSQPFDRAGDYGAVNRALSGSFNVKVFGEIRVPILSDMAFADTLASKARSAIPTIPRSAGITAVQVRRRICAGQLGHIRGAYNRAGARAQCRRALQHRRPGLHRRHRSLRQEPEPQPERLAFCVSQGIAQTDIASGASALGLTQQSGGKSEPPPRKDPTPTRSAA